MKTEEYGTIKELTLELLKVEASTIFSGTSLRELRVDKYEDHILRNIRYKLHTLIPAEDMKSETHAIQISYPDGWWEMFKKQYFTVWLQKKFPIRYITKKETVKFTAYNLYPKLPTVYPTCGYSRQIIVSYVEGRESCINFNIDEVK